MKIQNDGMSGLCREVPGDDLLAVRRGQQMLFGLRKTGRGGRGALGARYRKQERPLSQIQDGKAADITDRNDDEQPFQDGHGFPRVRYIPLTMFSVIFLASPSSIMVLSR